MTEPEKDAALAAELCERLGRWAMLAQEAMPRHDVAAAVLATGVELARAEHGPEATATWLREIAAELGAGVD